MDGLVGVIGILLPGLRWIELDETFAEVVLLVGGGRAVGQGRVVMHGDPVTGEGAAVACQDVHDLLHLVAVHQVARGGIAPLARRDDANPDGHPGAKHVTWKGRLTNAFSDFEREGSCEIIENLPSFLNCHGVGMAAPSPLMSGMMT